MNKLIYHANCNDGFCAAYLFWKKYGDSYEYIPMSYGTVVDYTLYGPDDIILLVDFSFKRPVLLELASIVKYITIIDHHKTAAEDLVDLPSNVTVYFDMERSGAALAYDYLNATEPIENSIPSQYRPAFVNYVQDRDLWKWALADSKDVNAFIASIPYDFAAWDSLLDTPLDTMIACGKAINRMLAKQIESATKHAIEYELDERMVLAVNSTVNFSEVAGELATKSTSGIGIAWLFRTDGKYQYSLRSRTEVDCSEVAKKYGGGGHKNAAGFESDTFILKTVPNLVGRTIKVPTQICDSGYVHIWGYSPRGNTFLLPPESFYNVFESDEKGNKLDNKSFRIGKKEMEKYINDQ